MTRRVHVASFADGHALVAAARACDASGLKIADAYTPHPVHGLDEVLRIRRSRLPIVCFAGGLIGLLIALGFQYWSSATDWPLNVGGKPFDSFPAFVPVAFETMVLFAGLATAAGLLLRSRLWPGPRAAPPHTRVTDDRYVLVVAERDGSVPAERIRELLRSNGAVSCTEDLREERPEDAS
jgi:hypothetical protein